MSVKSDQITDDYGQPVPGANIYVFNEDGTYAQLTSDGVTPLSQPVEADELGTYTYYAADNVYREDIYYGGKLRYRQMVIVGSPPQFKGDPGGNVMSIGLFTGAFGLTIPTGTDLVTVSGTSAAGDDGAGRQFAYSASVNAAYVAAHPTTSFVSANGRGFREAGLAVRLAASGGAVLIGTPSGTVQTRLDDIASTLDDIAGTITSGRLAYKTYAQLAAVASTQGQVAEVPTTDTGTHTDPVVGGTANNAGVFRYSTSPAGWQRIADTDALVASGYAAAASVSATSAATNARVFDSISVGQRQMFDKTRVTPGKYVDHTTGNYVTSSGFNVSHWMPVVGGQWYSFSSSERAVWRDVTGAYISGIANGSASPAQAPSNAVWFEAAISDGNLAVYQFEAGKTRTPYQSYNPSYRPTQFFYRTVPNSALQALVPKKNLVDPARLIADYYVVNASGAFGSNSSYNLVLPVPCVAGATYYSATAVEWACYDSNMGYLSGGSRGSAGSFTVHASAAYLSVAFTDANLAAAQIERSSIGTAYEAFTLVVDPSMLMLTGSTVIANGAIGTSALALAKPAKNLFDPTDPDAQTGHYIINTTGAVGANAAYACTGFIPVVAGKTYTQATTAGGAQQFNAFYDANKAFLSSGGNNNTITAPAGAAYLRCSYDIGFVGAFQVEEGRIASLYEDYRLVVPDSVQPERIASVILPRKTYILGGSTGAGREQANLYLANAARGMRGAWQYDVDASYGMQLGDANGLAAPCWRIEPGNISGTGSAVNFYNIAAGSTFTLGLSAIATNLRSSAYASTTVNVVDKTVNTTSQIRLHAIGDSITDWSTPTTGVDTGVNYLQQVPKKLTNAKLQGLRHYSTDHAALNRDGRSGWSLTTYLTNYARSDGADSPFMFPDGISSGVYRGNTAFWAGVVNASGTAFAGFEKLARGWADTGPFLYSATGYPTSPTAGWVVYDPSKAAGHKFQKWSGSAWVDNDTQPSTWSFDYGKFLARFPEAFADGNPTHVYIMSMANDFQTTQANPANLASWKARLDTMITSVRAALPTAKIIVGLSPLGGDQDSWAWNYGAGQTGFRYNDNIKAAWEYTLAQYDTSAQEAAGVYVCAAGLRVDPLYGYDKGSSENPNIYATSTTIQRTASVNWVHPNSSVGHPQMGDALAALVQATR